jgi:hypothetical protein
MGAYNGQSAPIQTQNIWGVHGDQEILSRDNSPYRSGSLSMMTSASPVWTLCGNQPVMYYWSHNCAIDSVGNIMGRDEADGCSLVCFCEDNTWRYFGAVTGVKGALPVFIQTYGIDVLTAYSSVARAGCAGQLITATIATPGTSLTTATPANVITTPFLSLTAGRWDISGTCCFLPAATTSITQIACGINVTSATLPAAGSGLLQETHAALVPTAIPQCFTVPTIRVNIAATTPYYLVAQAAFTVSTLTAFGTLNANRVG